MILKRIANLQNTIRELEEQNEELKNENEHLKEEIRYLEDDLRDNYRRITLEEQYGISERDFI